MFCSFNQTENVFHNHYGRKYGGQSCYREPLICVNGGQHTILKIIDNLLDYFL